MKALKNSPVHGTAIAVGGQGFLFLGASGSGKSGLALQMMALGAKLVSDDQVLLRKTTHTIEMSAPETLDGLIEARGIGILKVQDVTTARLTYVVDLDADAEARLPQFQKCDVLGHRIDLINGANVSNLVSLLMILGRGQRHS